MPTGPYQIQPFTSLVSWKVGTRASYIFMTFDFDGRVAISHIFDFNGSLYYCTPYPSMTPPSFLGRHRGKGASGEYHPLKVL